MIIKRTVNRPVLISSDRIPTGAASILVPRICLSQQGVASIRKSSVSSNIAVGFGDPTIIYLFNTIR